MVRGFTAHEQMKASVKLKFASKDEFSDVLLMLTKLVNIGTGSILEAISVEQLAPLTLQLLWS